MSALLLLFLGFVRCRLLCQPVDSLSRWTFVVVVVVLLFLCSSFVVGDIFQQAEALLSFYDETGGASSWGAPMGWSRNTLQFPNSSALWCLFGGVTCDANRAVTALALRRVGLNGVWSGALLAGVGDTYDARTRSLAVQNNKQTNIRRRRRRSSSCFAFR